MNWRRGFIRLWFVFSVIWVLFSFASGYRSIAHEFELAAFGKFEGVPLVSTYCRPKNLLGYPRGREGKDYRRLSDSDCWYELSNFLRLYPEYKDGSEVSNITPAPFSALGSVVSLAFGVPLGLLGFGMVLGWVMVGFKTKTSN